MNILIIAWPNDCRGAATQIIADNPKRRVFLACSTDLCDRFTMAIEHWKPDMILIDENAFNNRPYTSPEEAEKGLGYTITRRDSLKGIPKAVIHFESSFPLTRTSLPMISIVEP